MANLGFVGLGVMGGEMVNRLLAKGHTVTGYNRTRPKLRALQYVRCGRIGALGSAKRVARGINRRYCQNREQFCRQARPGRSDSARTER